jgi:alcohol dehydrogenase/L-iditol 2-dehydrogenase
MRAALLVSPGRLEIDEVPDPEPGPDDVRILVGGVGLCGSDGSVFSGKWKAPSLPWIMGHEAFGTIEQVGERVSPARVGETVVLEPNIVCLECAQCRAGRTSACERRQSVGMNRAGALAERLVVPAAYAWPVNPLGPETLVCVEPFTVVETALRRLRRPLPAAALVVGAGAQGALMCLALLRRGLRVQVIDVNQERVQFALGLGAEPQAADERFELVVDTVGSPEAHAAAVDHAAVGGTVLVLGLDARPLELSSQTLVRRQLELRGSLTYDHPVDFRETIALVRGGVPELSRVVAHEYALADAQEAFDRGPLAPGKTWIRIVARPITGAEST